MPPPLVKAYRGVRKPVTVPWIVNVPCGEGKLWNGMMHVIVFLIREGDGSALIVSARNMDAKERRYERK